MRCDSGSKTENVRNNAATHRFIQKHLLLPICFYSRTSGSQSGPGRRSGGKEHVSLFSWLVDFLCTSRRMKSGKGGPLGLLW